MSKFEEIQEQYISLRDAEVAYWERLDGARQQIRQEFSNFLGVDPDEKAGPSGEPRLWFGVKKSFSGNPERDLIHESDELVFTLNIVLDHTPSSFPPSTLSFRLRIKFVADQYMIREHDEERYITIMEGFTPFYEHLYQACKKRLALHTRTL